MALTAENKKIIKAITNEARRRYGSFSHADLVKLKSAFETGRVESNFTNSSAQTDHDSEGWRQERASLYKNPTNVRASVRRYFNEADQLYKPGESSGELAANVQRPAAQYRGRYAADSHEAEQLLHQFASGGQAPAQAAAGGNSSAPSSGAPTADRRAALMNYISQRGRPGATLQLAQDLKASDAVTPAAPAASSSGTIGGHQIAGGIANFDGTKVAAWIKPELEYARAHGWKGSVTSGYRSFADQKRIYDSGVRPAAKPGTSNHEGKDFPRGAVDVTDAQQLAQILKKKGSKLVWAGAKDPVHFSHPHGGSY